jgi:hypothetical protein
LLLTDALTRGGVAAAAQRIAREVEAFVHAQPAASSVHGRSDAAVALGLLPGSGSSGGGGGGGAVAPAPA